MDLVFHPCSYQELQSHKDSGEFILSAWSVIMADYINGLEVIENTDGKTIALMYYDSERNDTCMAMIMAFEVRKSLRKQGLGRKIITQFLEEHQVSIELTPNSEGAVDFWRKCGFSGDIYGLRYYPQKDK